MASLLPTRLLTDMVLNQRHGMDPREQCEGFFACVSMSLSCVHTNNRSYTIPESIAFQKHHRQIMRESGRFGGVSLCCLPV